MRRRNFFRLLAGALAAPALPSVELPSAAPVSCAPIRHWRSCDIRAIVMQNMLLDIQAEEDRRFLSAVDSIVHANAA
jgi:hypothetical protein